MAGSLLISSRATCQWQVIHQFPGSESHFALFPSIKGMEHVGFVEIESGYDINAQLWRTSDNGATWKQCFFPEPFSDGGGFPMYNLDFCDTFLGWAAYGNNGEGGCAKTTDGGLTWTPNNLEVENPGDVYYQPKTHKVFLTNSWSSVYFTYLFVSSDSGASWTTWGDGYPREGIAFSTDSTGIASIGGVDQGNGPLLITSDAGNTWQTIYNLSYTSLPLAIPNTQTYFEATDNDPNIAFGDSGVVYKSTDGGLTWNCVFQLSDTLPTMNHVLNEAMKMDECGNIYLGTVFFGFYVSPDTGTTWYPLPRIPLRTGDPQIDTMFFLGIRGDDRFSVRDGYSLFLFCR